MLFWQTRQAQQLHCTLTFFLKGRNETSTVEFFMLFGCMWLVLICSLSQTGFRCGGFILEMEYFIRSGWCWQFCSAMLLYYSDLVNIKQHFTTYCWKLNMFWSMFLSTSLLQVRKHTHLYSVWMLGFFFFFFKWACGDFWLYSRASHWFDSWSSLCFSLFRESKERRRRTTKT